MLLTWVTQDTRHPLGSNLHCLKRTTFTELLEQDVVCYPLPFLSKEIRVEPPFWFLLHPSSMWVVFMYLGNLHPVEQLFTTNEVLLKQLNKFVTQGSAFLFVILPSWRTLLRPRQGNTKISAVRSLADICFLHVLIQLIRCIIVFFFSLGILLVLSICLLYTSPSPRDLSTSRMPSSA